MDHLVITSEEENAVYGTTSNCWGIGLNCVAQSLIVNNFRRVMTTCQRQGTWTLQVGPLGIVHQKFLPIFVHQKPLTSIMRNSHSLHCLQGVPKKMSHSVLKLKSVLEVRFCFSTCVSESEFRNRSIWAHFRYPFRIVSSPKTQDFLSTYLKWSLNCVVFDLCRLCTSSFFFNAC